jgi:hypothetical protein
MNLNEKSSSKSQQRLMGMVYAYKKGELKLDKLDKTLADKIKSIADGGKTKDGEQTKGMSLKAAKDFAKTKHEGLPETVQEQNIISFSEFKLEESKESDIRKNNIGLYNQIQVAKQTLKYSDAGAIVMGGMTKDEARALLKKHDIKINENSSKIYEGLKKKKYLIVYQVTNYKAMNNKNEEKLSATLSPIYSHIINANNNDQAKEEFKSKWNKIANFEPKPELKIISVDDIGTLSDSILTY